MYLPVRPVLLLPVLSRALPIASGSTAAFLPVSTHRVNCDAAPDDYYITLQVI